MLNFDVSIALILLSTANDIPNRPPTVCATINDCQVSEFKIALIPHTYMAYTKNLTPTWLNTWHPIFRFGGTKFYTLSKTEKLALNITETSIALR